MGGGPASAGKLILVPSDCGGSFLSQDDFSLAVETVLAHPADGGRVFNLASAYVTWEGAAQMVVARPASRVEVVPKAQ